MSRPRNDQAIHSRNRSAKASLVRAQIIDTSPTERVHLDEPLVERHQRAEEHQEDVRSIGFAVAMTEVQVSNALARPNEIEAITALAAKSFARVLRVEQTPRGSLRRYRFKSRSEALNAAPEDFSWSVMGELEDSEPGSFAALWEQTKQFVRDELESGQRAAAVACGQDSPLNRARFLVLREKYIDEWQPRNVLESQLIDAICQAQTICEYWMKLATERVGPNAGRTLHSRVAWEMTRAHDRWHGVGARGARRG